MVKEKIKMELSPDGCVKAIRKLERYRKKIPKRNAALCENLAVLLATYAETALKNDFVQDPGYETSDPDTVSFKWDKGKPGLVAISSMIGSGDDLLFIEFGAGVHFNGNLHGSPHPQGVALGYTIGDYGLGLGQYDEWWFRDGDTWKISHGTYAVMPMLKASIELKKNKSAVLAAAELAWNDGKIGGSP